MSPIPTKSKVSPQAKLVGSGTAGVLELFFFHPIDTCAKRLMTCKDPIVLKGESMGATMTHVSEIVFRDAVNKPLMSRIGSLFPGLSFAMVYKISQRVYKFGGQPWMKDYLNNRTNFGPWMKDTFGQKWGKPLTDATAGSLIGIGEVALLPFDVLKIKAQTNPGALAGRGLVGIIKSEGSSLYAGAGMTMLRNAPGSFALFGGNAFVKEFIFRLEDYGSATFFQTFVSSTVGAVCSIGISSPMDVVKTRIQAANLGEKVSGAKVISTIVKTEGMGAFFKGITPKILTVSPKLVASFTLAQWIINNFDTMFAEMQAKKKQ